MTTVGRSSPSQFTGKGSGQCHLQQIWESSIDTVAIPNQQTPEIIIPSHSLPKLVFLQETPNTRNIHVSFIVPWWPGVAE